MKHNGRRSAESEFLSTIAYPGRMPERPAPPKELSPDQAKIWQDYVNGMPADWFPPKHQKTLANLCGLVTDAALLRSELHWFAEGIPKDGPGFKRYMQVRKSYESVVLSVTTLETKLRLTPQSKDDSDRAGKARAEIANAAPPRPWKTVD